MNAAIQDKLVPASFEYTDAITGETETIELQLKRMAFTQAAPKKLVKALNDEDTETIASLLDGLVVEWNLDWNGEPFPPNTQNIGSRPAEFIDQLGECVFRKLFPNQLRALPSPNGSEQTENSASSVVTNLESDSDSPKPADTGE